MIGSSGVHIPEEPFSWRDCAASGTTHLSAFFSSANELLFADGDYLPLSRFPNTWKIPATESAGQCHLLHVLSAEGALPLAGVILAPLGYGRRKQADQWAKENGQQEETYPGSSFVAGPSSSKDRENKPQSNDLHRVAGRGLPFLAGRGIPAPLKPPH